MQPCEKFFREKQVERTIEALKKKENSLISMPQEIEWGNVYRSEAGDHCVWGK